MSEHKNILLINFGGIGDEILFSPVIDALKKQYENCHITLCLESRSKAFLSMTNSVDDCFFADIKTKNKYVEMLKLYFRALFGSYDTVISAGASPLISLLLFFTGIKTRIGYKTSSLSKRLLTHAVKLNKEQYAANMYYDLVKPICDKPFELPSITADGNFEERIQNTVTVHPGVSKISLSKNIYKTFDGKVWAEIISKLLKNNKTVYLAGGPDDEKCIEEIRKELKNIDNPNFIDMYGKTKNINDLVKLIKKSEVLICSDSAPMHIGVATGTKTVAFFGPTNDKKLLPDDNRFIAVKNDCDCRPCLWDKRLSSCRELHCLKINTDDFIKAL